MVNVLLKKKNMFSTKFLVRPEREADHSHPFGGEVKE
jgi:hypothetical protein